VSSSKILVLMLSINIFLYLGGVQLFDNDILENIVNINNEQVTSYSDIQDAAPLDTQASTNSFASDSNGFSFFDALNVSWAFILFLLNLIFAPIGLLVVAGLPLIVQLALGVPLGVAYFFGLIMLIRGVGQ